MTTTEPVDTIARLLGWRGLWLGIAGCAGIVSLSEPVSGTANVPAPVTIGLIAPLALAAVLLTLPATRETPLIWLLSGL